MALTTAQMEEKLSRLERSISGMKTMLDNMQKDIDSRVRINQLTLSETNTDNDIKDINDNITKIEAKLTTIKLPTETRWYLTENEANDFRNSFSRLQAMLADTKSLYDNLVAYAANL